MKKIPDDEFTHPNYKLGVLRHIVLFRYKDTVTFKQQAEVAEKFWVLQYHCKRNGIRYIQALEAGLQISLEGAHKDMQHGFLMRFTSEGDRNYYVGDPIVTNPAFYDPVHHEFKAYVGPLLEDVVVFDYRPGSLPFILTPEPQP